jgi:hypothetical protein
MELAMIEAPIVGCRTRDHDRRPMYHNLSSSFRFHSTLIVDLDQRTVCWRKWAWRPWLRKIKIAPEHFDFTLRKIVDGKIT